MLPFPTAPPTRGGTRRGHNLALALWELRDDCLLFMADPRVPFTNNLAKQTPAHGAKMKISGGFRTQDGAEHFACNAAAARSHARRHLVEQPP